MQLNFFLEIAFVLNSNTLHIYMHVYFVLFGGMLLVLFAKGQFFFCCSCLFCRILVCASWWANETYRFKSLILIFTSYIYNCISYKLFILNGCSKFTALSLNFAINEPLDYIDGFFSQIPTISKIYWPVLVHYYLNVQC